MPPDVMLAVLAAALLHAGWNALLKRQAGDPLLTATVISVGSAVVALPSLIFTGLPMAASAPYVVVSAVIHIGYFILVGLAYRHGDYSAVYPLVRGCAPLFTALFGWLLLGERLALGSIWGVALLCAGVVGLGWDGLKRGGLRPESMATLASLIFVIVVYTLVDGIGARRSGNALAYVLAMMALNGALMLVLGLTFQGSDLRATLRTQWRTGVGGGAMLLIAYAVALWAMTKAPIGLVSALRETSVLFACLIATFALGERFGPVRWLAASAIVAGLALIGLK